MQQRANEAVDDARVRVEIAIESVAGALAAADGGADRVELCQALGEGGLTPSAGLCAAAVRATTLPVFAMLRPRAGDFCYSAAERDVIRRDLDALGAAGAAGFVVGGLRPDGELDTELLRDVLARAGDRPVTCHRAFDLCADPQRAIDALCDLGVARLLTSGQAANAPAGAAAIRAAVERAAGRLIVMAGAGVRADNVTALVAATGVREVHLSAGAFRDSAMQFRRPGVPMGSSPAPGEYALRVTDPTSVAGVVAALRNGGDGATISGR
ncbi:MAG: copper homeostasis protein CutC [Planctomycetes bacterium]|nr:copper homeostasis protein CutC [Planctomycetota bacterium]